VPIIQALSKEGIAAAFFSGSVAGLPMEDERLIGVRLAILDMDLIGGNAKDKSKVAALINVLGRILHPNNGPYGILAWTKHKELVSMLDAQALSEDIAKPVFVASMRKPDFSIGPGQYDFGRVYAKLKTEIKVFSPLLFLGAWEQMSFDAASAVTNALSTISKPNSLQPESWRTQWKVQLLQLISEMVRAETGQRVIDSPSTMLAFFGCLNPLHTDRMEAALADTTKPLRTVARQLSKENSKGCGSELKAKINTMLHIAFDNVGTLQPGNLYKFPGIKAFQTRLPGLEALAGELLQEIKKKDGDLDKEQMKSNREVIVSSSLPVLVEVSAVCDHAQDSVRFARLLAGLLVPQEEMKKIKKADFIWREGPFFVGPPVEKTGQHWLVLSARYLVTLNRRSVTRLKPLARMRSQLLTALQAWLGDHASRPGVLMLRG